MNTLLAKAGDLEFRLRAGFVGNGAADACARHVTQQRRHFDCRIAYVSEPTPQHAFRERYGLSPDQFAKCWQLNTARRLIRSAPRDRPVAAIAADCGFLDPSVFARHYRRLHGQLRSETMARLKT